MPRVAKKTASEASTMKHWMNKAAGEDKKKKEVKEEEEIKKEVKEEPVEVKEELASEVPVKMETEEDVPPSAKGRAKRGRQMKEVKYEEPDEEEEGEAVEQENETPPKKSRKQAVEKKKEAKPKRTTTKVKKEEEGDEEAEVPKKKTKKSVKKGETAEQKLLRETEAVKVISAVGASNKYLGYHVSAAGSLEQAIYNAVSTGCRSFAMFVRNQRTWNHKPMEEEVVEGWAETLKETNYDLSMILPHGSYLMNPGSPDEEKLKKTRDAMLDECRRCERLGIKYYNFHPGSTTGVGTRDECIARVAETINYVIENTSFITLVIETMAGQGHTVGGKFAEIKKMIDGVKEKQRVGVCIDTCHIFAAGYDIRTPEKYEKTMKEFGEVIGFEYLKAFHINDSKGELGCNLDRHEHIGKGKIGKKGFELLMNDSRLDGIPMVLETPEGDYVQEMILMYGMDKVNKE